MKGKGWERLELCICSNTEDSNRKLVNGLSVQPGCSRYRFLLLRIGLQTIYVCLVLLPQFTHWLTHRASRLQFPLSLFSPLHLSRLVGVCQKNSTCHSCQGSHFIIALYPSLLLFVPPYYCRPWYLKLCNIEMEESQLERLDLILLIHFAVWNSLRCLFLLQWSSAIIDQGWTAFRVYGLCHPCFGTLATWLWSKVDCFLSTGGVEELRWSCCGIRCSMQYSLLPLPL
jgi:hypothetical protein